MRMFKGGVILLAVTALFVWAADEKDKKKEEPKEVVIKITGKGSKAKYDPETATVTVGQSVVWQNDSNVAHTATSDKDGLFNTDKIAKDAKSKAILFDEKLFKDAGGEAGGEVKVPYHCAYHDEMKASITLKSAKKE